MERILKLRIPLYFVLHDDKILKPVDKALFDIGDVFWITMEDMVPVFEPFAEVKKTMFKSFVQWFQLDENGEPIKESIQDYDSYILGSTIQRSEVFHSKPEGNNP